MITYSMDSGKVTKALSLNEFEILNNYFLAKIRRCDIMELKLLEILMVFVIDS